METQTDKIVPIASRAGRLADALARARTRLAEADDTDATMRADRLAALADELKALGDELPPEEDERFPLVLSAAGDRIVVDDLAYVALSADNQDYAFWRQHRGGQALIAESAERAIMVDAVADYVAERMVGREAQTGPAHASGASAQQTQTAPPAETPVTRGGLGFWGGFWLFVLGGVCAATGLFTYAWLSVG